MERLVLFDEDEVARRNLTKTIGRVVGQRIQSMPIVGAYGVQHVHNQRFQTPYTQPFFFWVILP